jgi:hypothetical protein
VMSAVQAVALACSAAWLRAVQDAQPATRQRSGKMTRLQVINFCDACR